MAIHRIHLHQLFSPVDEVKNQGKNLDEQLTQQRLMWARYWLKLKNLIFASMSCWSKLLVPPFDFKLGFYDRYTLSIFKEIIWWFDWFLSDGGEGDIKYFTSAAFF